MTTGCLPTKPVNPPPLSRTGLQVRDMDNLDDANARHSELQLNHDPEKSTSTAAITAPQQTSEDGGGAGVLLYYKYVDLREELRSAVRDWYLHNCGFEGLQGR